MKKKMIKKKLSNVKINYLLIIIIVSIPFIKAFFSFDFDNDFWFTINQGRYVIESGFPTKAINSMHDINFIYQSWGSGVLYYLVYNYIGSFGVLLLLISVLELISFFYYKLCLCVSNNKKASLLITMVVSIIYSLYFFSTRPHIFTTLNVTIMLYLLEKYIKTSNRKYLYLLPVISLFQINMHGIYFIILLVIMIPYLINAFKIKFLKIQENGYIKKDLMIIFLLMCITGFINPYGFKTIIYGFSSYESGSIMNNNISELLAPNFHYIEGKIIIVLVITVYAIYMKTKKKISLRYYLLLLGTSYLALDAKKSLWFFLFCTLFPLTMFLKKDEDVQEKKELSREFYILNTLFILLIDFSLLTMVNTNKIPQINNFMLYLDDHVINKEKMKLYVSFEDGSYAEWRGYNCYIDPRAEIFLKSNNGKADIFEEYINMQKLKIDYEVFIKKYDFDYLLLNKKEDRLYYLFKINPLNYGEVFSDDNYSLYKKNSYMETKK